MDYRKISIRLRTGSDPTDNNRFRSRTVKIVKLLKNNFRVANDAYVYKKLQERRRESQSSSTKQKESKIKNAFFSAGLSQVYLLIGKFVVLGGVKSYISEVGGAELKRSEKSRAENLNQGD